MTLARAIRLLLGLFTICIVGWSFFDVAHRTIVEHEAEQNRPITLTVLHWGDQAEDRVDADLCDRFMAQNPKVRIIRINPGSGDYDSKLKTMMAAGTPPDVFYLKPESLPDLATMKLIAPLDKQFDKEPKAWRDDFFPILLNGFRYNVKTQRVGPGGALYGLPKDCSTIGFWVNLNLFKAAGVPVPYGGWTWDTFQADMRKITALKDTPKYRGRGIYGGFFQLWPANLRNVLWTYGGGYFKPPGFRHLNLTSPQSQSALQMIVDTRLKEHTTYNPSGIAKDGGQEFFNGDIGCIGPIGRWMTPRYASITSFKYDFVPMPYETVKASQIFYNAWTMSSQTKHPNTAYKLIKFLCGRPGQIMMAHLGLAIPSLKSVAYSKNFLSPPNLPKINTQAFLNEMKIGRIAQVPRQPEFIRILGDRITNSIQLEQETTMQSAVAIQKAWTADLDSPLKHRTWPAMPWITILSVTGAVLATLTLVLWLKARREKLGPLDRAQERSGFMFIAPWLIGFLVLTLGPMIASLLLSFGQWTGMDPISDTRSVGTANYRQLFTADPTFYKSLWVTAYFVILAVPIGQIAALAVALLMNLRVRGIAFFRTIYFVPSVVSGAALAVLWSQIFNNDYGIMNQCLRPIAHLFGTTPPDWFGKDAQHWAIPAFVIMGLWGVGGGMIIYLAGLKGISASLYEAATIDGAGPFRRLWNITLPMLSPLIFYNLVMGIIGSFQVFTQAYIMTGPGPNNATLFYVLSLYMQAFEFHNMGYASAMAWILFVLVLALTLLVFRASRNLVYYEGLKV